MTDERDAPQRFSDRIELKGLRVRGFHGVFEHERREGQEFVVDATLQVDVRAASATDDLAATVDYGALADALAEVVAGEPVDLIETLAERLAAICLADPRVGAARVSVHKPQAPIAHRFDDVVVSVLRHRSETVTAAARPVVLALGSNLGDRVATLQAAVDSLAALPGVRLDGVSPVVETAPVGGPPGQADHLNAVVLAHTDLAPEALLASCHGIEAALGRRRRERWGPRTLDVDLIAYGDEQRATPALWLPHPRAAERAFVLVPWSLADPGAMLPQGRVADLAEHAADRAGVRPRPDLALRLPQEDR